MIGKIAAITASGACAAIIVALVPEPTSAVAASVPTAVVVTPISAAPMSRETQPASVRPESGAEARPDCQQAWPNYEPSCLRDTRRADDRGRTVRMIALQVSPAQVLSAKALLPAQAPPADRRMRVKR
jgi:hypothetical protein